MCNRQLSIAVLLIASLLVSAHAAENLRGATNPKFLHAVDKWLADNDRDSLPVLSSLAKDGNATARLLLSRIELTDRASTDYIRSLSRDELLDLFRPVQLDGPFRSSWMKVEVDRQNKIARILYDATSYGINLPAIKELYDIGEIQAAEHLIRKVAVDGNQRDQDSLLAYLGPGSELNPYVRGFRYSRDGVTTAYAALQHIIGTNRNAVPDTILLDDDTDTRNAMQFVDIGYQANDRIIEYGADNKHFEIITRWILTAPETSGISMLCRDVCAEEDVPACANTAFGLIGGYYEAIRFDSPMETVIPQSVFLNSARAVGMTLRRIATVRTDSYQEIFTERELADKSQCLADAVRTVGASND